MLKACVEGLSWLGGGEGGGTFIWLSAIVVYSLPPLVGSGWLRLIITLCTMPKALCAFST